MEAAATNKTLNRTAIDRLTAGALVILLLSVCALIFARSVPECLWGHLRAGLDYLAAGHLIGQDPYAYTSDIAWIDHEWLFEVILAACYNAGGIIGINILKLALVEILIALLCWQLLSRGIPILITCSLIVLSLVLLGAGLFAPRPHLFSAIFFVITLICLERASYGNRRWLLGVPVLFIPWCNIHGGFMAGFGEVAIWSCFDIVESVLEQKSLKQKSLQAIFKPRSLGNMCLPLACAAACLINPYGARLLTFLQQTLSVPRPEFADWNPINLADPYGMMYIILLLATILILARNKERLPLALLAILITACIQPFAALRHVSFAVLAILVLGAQSLSNLLADVAPAAGSLNGFSPQQKQVFAGLCLLSSFIVAYAALPALQTLQPTPSVPRQAVAIIKVSNVSGNLAPLFDWGDYCIWHLTPKIKVSTDWRRETAYSAAQNQINLNFTHGTNTWDELLQKWPTDIVLAGKAYAAFPLMRLNPDWQLCYEDNLCALFARKNSPIALRLLKAKEKIKGPLPERFPQ